MEEGRLQGERELKHAEEHVMLAHDRGVKITCSKGEVHAQESICRQSRKLRQQLQAAALNANGDLVVTLDEPCHLVRQVLDLMRVDSDDATDRDAVIVHWKQSKPRQDVLKLLGVASAMQAPLAEHLCSYVLETVQTAEQPNLDELRAALGITETTSAVQVEQDEDVQVVTVTNAQAMAERTEEEIEASKNQTHCEVCMRSFSAMTMVKRHHCRSCYRAACHACSNHRLAFSREDAERRRQKMEIGLSSDVLRHLSTDLLRDYKLERVCNLCHDFLNKTIGFTDVCRQTRAGLLRCNFTLPVLFRMANLSKEVAATVADIVKTIGRAGRQLPWYTPTEEEKRLLLTNCELFNGHHRMVATLVKCVDWNTVQHRASQQMRTACAVARADVEGECRNADRVLKLLTSKVQRRLSCNHVGCLVCRGEAECKPFAGYSTDPEVTQQQQVDCFDAYELLTNGNIYVHTRLRSLLVKTLSTMDTDLRPLLVHSLLQTLKEDAWPLNSALWFMLLDWTDDQKTRFEIFLNLIFLTKTEDFSDTATGLLMHFIRSVHDRHGEEAAKELEATQHLISALHKQDDPKAMLDMLSHIQGTARLPVNLDATVIDVLLKDAKRTTGCNGMTHLPLRVHVDGGSATAQRVLRKHGQMQKQKQVDNSRERSVSLPNSTAAQRPRTTSFQASSSFSSPRRASGVNGSGNPTQADAEDGEDREQPQEGCEQPDKTTSKAAAAAATAVEGADAAATPRSSSGSDGGEYTVDDEKTATAGEGQGQGQGQVASEREDDANKHLAEVLATKPHEWEPLPLDSTLGSTGSSSDGDGTSRRGTVARDASGVTCSIGFGVKRDDVRVDNVAVQVIQMAKLLLSRGTSGDASLAQHVLEDEGQEGKLPFACGHREATRLVTYNVVPTKPNLGLVEWVDDAVSVASILHMPEGFSQFIGRCGCGQGRENMTYSLAAFSVLVYLLGVGDRHMENEMMTRDGQLFHIDFGYLLGRDPKKFVDIKFGVLGKMLYSTSYETADAFVELAAEVYLRLRPFSHVLVPMLTSLFKLTPAVAQATIGKEEEARKLLLSRFRLDQSEEEARAGFMEELRQELNSKQHAFLSAQRALASTSRDVGSAAYTTSQRVLGAMFAMASSVLGMGGSADDNTDASVDVSKHLHNNL